MNRLSRVEYYINMAKMASLRSTCPRASVGAVLTNHNRVVGVGYNGGPKGKCHCNANGCLVTDDDGRCMLSIHAEINAILSREGQLSPTDNLIMYCTHSPCNKCYNIMVQYGVKLIIYDKFYNDRITTKLQALYDIPIYNMMDIISISKHMENNNG